MELSVAHSRFAGLRPALKSRSVAKDPRAEILKEVVAGLLWMAFDPPEDTPRSELESIAAHLIGRIQSHACRHVIEAEIRHVQRHQFCRISPPAFVTQLVERMTALVEKNGAAYR